MMIHPENRFATSWETKMARQFFAVAMILP
jgi:hypothetical protein